MQNLHGVFTVCTQRAHNEPTALWKTPQRCHSVLSNTLWKRQAAAFVLSMLKVNAAAWRSRPLHSVSSAFAQRCWRLHSVAGVCTALLAFAQRCWRLHSAHRRSAFFKTLSERCKDASLVWQGFYFLFKPWTVLFVQNSYQNMCVILMFR